MNYISFTDNVLKTTAFRLEMKRILDETNLFYSKETALGPHIKEKGTKGL